MEKVYKYGDRNWKEFIGKMNSGEEVQIDEEVFDYFLEVLPPVYMGKHVSLPGGKTVHASFGFAEGAEYVTAFWQNKGCFYCQQTNEMNPNC